jgi:S-formylglutathione hydrolase FrmB
MTAAGPGGSSSLFGTGRHLATGAVARSRWALRHLSGSAGAALLTAAAAGVVALIATGAFDRLDMLHGTTLWAPVGLAALGLITSVAGRPIRWWYTTGVVIVVSAAVVVAVARWWIRHSGLVLDHYPNLFVVYVWLAVTAVGIAATGWWTGRPALRAVRILNAPLASLGAFLLINSYYGYWPTVATLLNKPVAGQISKQAFAQLLQPRPATADSTPKAELVGHAPRADAMAPPTSNVSDSHGPAGVKMAPGQYGPVDIPGTAVNFAAALAYIWLPPDFATVSHAALPVIIMLPGWPGNVQDWTRAGAITDIANTWARAHGGRAPVIVLIDENGAAGHDTECVDSTVGNAESYLTRSVPAFLENNLGIVPNPSRWAVVGFSEGGTCALTLALRHPGLFGRFVDIAGDPAPNYWGGPVATLRVLYAGDTTAEDQHTPAWLLDHNRYPGMLAWFATGSADRLRYPTAHLVAQAAQAGIAVQSITDPGVHSWAFAARAFHLVYPALAGSLASGSTSTPVS